MWPASSDSAGRALISRTCWEGETHTTRILCLAAPRAKWLAASPRRCGQPGKGLRTPVPGTTLGKFTVVVDRTLLAWTFCQIVSRPRHPTTSGRRIRCVRIQRSGLSDGPLVTRSKRKCHPP